MTSINAADAKESFSELLNRVTQHNERIIITRRGKEVAAIIPYADLMHLEALLNKYDLDAAIESYKEARKDGAISLQDLKKK